MSKNNDHHIIKKSVYLYTNYRSDRMEANEYSINARYWGAISQNLDEFVCPSPVNIPEWASGTARWLGEGASVLEIGPGRGDLAFRTLSERSTIRDYHLADVSPDILAYVLARLEPVKGSTTVTTLQADLNRPDALHTLPPASIDRIILLNVFGYLDPDTALEQFRTALRPGGFLRFTVGDFEFFSHSGDYDAGLNRQLVTKKRRQIGTEVQPAGFTTNENGEQVPVFGYRRGYSREEITGMLASHGFADIDIQTVVIPLELWQRFRSGKSASPQQQSLENRWSGRPIWDVIARREA
ncbi:Methyltransferase type 12 [Methanosphaerula palustris E1-9c]|uniref:Methyltransferase type 12 n=2 Tax=Methanosphaerula palustris TaxID=475088 RepID=B8GFG9_METPE|nr:Methyltransferase type 12 [Methanosphaerula palustris E1-9c]